MDAPTQIPEARIRNFDEVYLPWTSEMVRKEAARCLQCPSRACVDACPLGNDIPGALRLAERGEFDRAAKVFRRTSNFSEICSRLCPQRAQCEGACPHPQAGRPSVAVGRIESFLADRFRRDHGWSARRPPCSGHRVAVVGAGAAGLTVSEILAEKGHCITVYDQWPGGGGALRYGTPRFRLDHALIRNRLAYLKTLGVEFVFDTRIGEERGLSELLESGFEAVFLGTGAGLPSTVSVPGQELRGVHDATSFLVRANVEQDLRPSDMEDPPQLGRRVVVVGGGETAVDCSRTAIRLGAAEVTCICSRAEKEAPGDPRNRALAREEGARFLWLAEPKRILGSEEGAVRGIELAWVDGAEEEGAAWANAASHSPERRSQNGPSADSSSLQIRVDSVVVVSPTRPDSALPDGLSELEVDEDGRVVADASTGRTTMDRVWAGGENVLGPSPVALSVAQARTAALAIHEVLTAGG